MRGQNKGDWTTAGRQQTGHKQGLRPQWAQQHFPRQGHAGWAVPAAAEDALGVLSSGVGCGHVAHTLCIFNDGNPPPLMGNITMH